ncbi:MAG: ATP-binding protein [Propionibacteriaceae bacterium]
MTLDLALPIQAAPPAPATDHAQWRIETLQMANWGGFHGRHEVRFSPGSTLMSGASGTGKSTVLDAYIALMMPSDTPFNGASNDASGRARSAEQRNLLTYLRGKMDTSRVDGSDEMRDHVLRGGDGGHIWGALAGTFVNDQSRRFTVVRLYFVTAGATVGGDVVTTYATFEGYLDVTRLEPLAATRFDKRSLRGAGLLPFNTFREFEDTVHTRLGIGGGDGGRKAMRLLARVQAGMEVKRVDSLYKSMVLEKPVTYQAADSALEHFADLEASYAKMLDEANKLKALQRLPELQRDLAEAEAKVLLISAFGFDQEGPSPFRLWRLRTERGLLDAAVVENRRDHRETTTTFGQAKADEAQVEQRLEQIAAEKRANGGDTIDARQREISSLRNRHGEVYSANIKFQTRTQAIGLVAPETVEQFAEAQSDSTQFLCGYDERETALRAEEEAVRDELSPLTTRQRELLEEKRSLHGRASGVPGPLHRARMRMAEAAGLDPLEDLPFVAELIEVLPEEERWRKAADATLAGLARTVLVDRRLRQQLSAAIDPIVISPRIRFQAIDLAEHQDWRGDPDWISGKLAFKDSAFSAWVQERVTDTGVDHLCVADAASLNGREPRVTPAGQTRNGDRGAHGESGDGSVIGFSNKRRLADIEAQLAALDPHLTEVRERIKVLQARLADLRRQREAHVYVQDAVWADIDYLGIDRRISELEAEIALLRASNSVLDALQAEEDRLKPLRTKANRDKVVTEEHLAKLAKEHGGLVSEQDAVQDAIDKIDNEQTAAVTDEQQTYLDDLFAANWDIISLPSFSANMRALRTRLREEAEAARQSQRRTVASMESMFVQYKERWTENNLGVSVASADGYREILDRIQSEGLYERRDRWRREFAAWSSDDLLRLNDAFDTAMDEIESRLAPINGILKTLPFGGKGRLQISSRRVNNDELRVFRRDLRTLSSGLALELTDQQIETRFKRLSDFMSRIRVPEGHTKPSTSQRDRYLDVRQHVVITAVCLDDSGNEIATYDSLGGKSGGETQELVAFIVGAALRYQLGDELRSRPRFAPVVLDEGFVKSDSEFAGRSVKVWQDLGFQLVIGAPLDKVTALEPHMDLLLTVTKNPKGFAFVSELVDAPDGPETEHVA